MRDRPSFWSAAGTHVFLCVLGCTMLVPFLWMLATSLKSESEVFQHHVLPESIRLGADGKAITTREGRAVFAAIPVAGPDGVPVLGSDGQPTCQRGAAVTVRNGNPFLLGSPGDRAESDTGEGLSDDLGLPIVNSLIMTDPDEVRALGGITRFRDPRTHDRYAEPVLVPPGDAVNEALARTWFRRYDADWPRMVAARWHGLIPLMLSADLREAWAGKSGKSEAVVVPGLGPVADPMQAGSFYLYQDCSWDEIGSPVRNRRLPTAVVDLHGQPIPFHPPVPLLAVEDEPLKGADGRNLLVFVGDEEKPRVLRGNEIVTEHHVRLMWSNYTAVLADPEIKMMLFAWNSLFIAVSAVVLQVLTSSLAAFAFARLEWTWRDRVFFAYLATLMIPGVVTLIPNYLILQHLGWLNTFWALVVPGAASAYGTFLLRQFMLGLPRGVEEAARMDGAGPLRIWWEIVLPMCRPALITLAIFTFVGNWQSFTWPLIVAPDESVRVLPVALQNFANSRAQSYNLLMAASLVMMVPMVALFIFGQRYFVKGINLGAIKG